MKVEFRVVEDTTGEVIERFVYTPYGQSSVLDANFAADSDGISDVAWEYRFTSREFDSETALHYFRTRLYHDGIGRFMSRDSLIYPNGYNTYAGYFAIGGVDPFGLEAGKGKDKKNRKPMHPCDKILLDLPVPDPDDVVKGMPARGYGDCLAQLMAGGKPSQKKIKEFLECIQTVKNIDTTFETDIDDLLDGAGDAVKEKLLDILAKWMCCRATWSTKPDPCGLTDKTVHGKPFPKIVDCQECCDFENCVTIIKNALKGKKTGPLEIKNDTQECYTECARCEKKQGP